MKNKYKKTLIACYLGFITQAISANFAPLLFLTFHRTYQISLGRIAFISTAFFFTQLLIDLFCAKYVDKIGYRRSVVASELFSAAGLIGLAVLPGIMPDPFAGILISVIIYAMGSGLIEVLVSPIVEACPFEHKESVMSLLHSFYCWGSVGVILLSTAFFAIFGIEHWKILACLWALLPLYNTFNFLTCPIESLTEEGEGLTIHQLCGIPVFWIALILMICAGASEISMAQWASAYAESAGYRIHPVTGVRKLHAGIDIPCSTGTTIVAAASGTVVDAGYNAYNGNYLKISHGNGLETMYLHCSKLLVSSGARVTGGQTIAKSGATGMVSGAHLHFVVKKNGNYVNPQNYL